MFALFVDFTENLFQYVMHVALNSVMQYWRTFSVEIFTLLTLLDRINKSDAIEVFFKV